LSTHAFLKKTFTQSDFIKNSLILTIGTTIAQIIPIAISPVLTRLYTPNEYGLLAVFISIATLFGIIATARYEMAIVLPESDSTAINIAALSCIITIFMSFISFLAVFFGNKILSDFFKSPDISKWLILVPISVFFTGAYQIINYWTIRTKQFKNLSISKISQTVTGTGANIGFGFLNLGTFGLIAGGILGQIVSTIVLFFQSLKSLSSNFKFVSFNEIKNQAKIHSDFPRVNSIQAFLDVFRDSLTIFLISYLFNSHILGLYSFTLRILKAPSGLIGSSVAQVFFQKAAQISNSGESLDKITKKIIVRLALIALPLFLILAFFAPLLFEFIFGAKWKEAGIYTQILSPWLFFIFISSPISQIPVILGKQKQSFRLSIVGSSLLIGTLLFGGIILKNIFFTLIILSFAQSIFLIFIILWTYNISKRGLK